VLWQEFCLWQYQWQQGQQLKLHWCHAVVAVAPVTSKGEESNCALSVLVQVLALHDMIVMIMISQLLPDNSSENNNAARVVLQGNACVVTLTTPSCTACSL
jgi:hypothetical protein